MRLWAAILATMALAGCGVPGVGALLGGGPKVAANVQAGQTNSQTIGVTRAPAPVLRDVTADRVRQSADENKVAADRVETVVVNEVPAWVILLALAGWLLPSPGEIGRWIARRLGWDDR
ncbi:bacteriophage spanin2 family protein [Sulfitobacter sp. 1A16787]|uniref:bacteriophage spanin2 family protein n=1 Tax=Sulfitobacter sp. 1A16787 TaxID=3368571 RepID=UPI003745621F